MFQKMGDVVSILQPSQRVRDMCTLNGVSKRVTKNPTTKFKVRS